MMTKRWIDGVSVRAFRTGGFQLGAAVMAVVFFFLVTGCGEPGGSGGWGSECWEGAGECAGSEMCVSGDCLPIQGRRFRITAEDGRFPESREYFVEVKYRDQNLVMRTSTSPSTRTPRWHESTVVTLQGRTDWWTLEVKREGLFGSSAVIFCRFDFDPVDFEVDSTWACGDSSEQFRWSVERVF